MELGNRLGQGETRTMHASIVEYGRIAAPHASAFIDPQGTLTRLFLKELTPATARLDEATWRRGICRIHVDTAPVVAQSYRQGTTILDTYFSASDGALKLTDFMPIATGDLHGGAPAARIVRILTCTRGSVRGTCELGIGALPAEPSSDERSAASRWLIPFAQASLSVDGGFPIRREDTQLTMPFALKAGEQAHLTLTLRTQPRASSPATLGDARKALAQCDAYWRDTEIAGSTSALGT